MNIRILNDPEHQGLVISWWFHFNYHTVTFLRRWKWRIEMIHWVHNRMAQQINRK